MPLATTSFTQGLWLQLISLYSVPKAQIPALSWNLQELSGATFLSLALRILGLRLSQPLSSLLLYATARLFLTGPSASVMVKVIMKSKFMLLELLQGQAGISSEDQVGVGSTL